MSGNLYWRPEDTGTSLPDALRFALERHFAHDRELRLCRSDIPYVEGLRDGGVDGAQALLDAIEQHNYLILWVAY